MLIGLDTRRLIFQQRGVVPKGKDSLGQADGTEVKEGLKGFISDFQKRPLTNARKRTLDEISVLQAASGNPDEGQGPESGCPDVAGRFRFKFKEGHSKNFRREVTFDWFINKQ
jgi:hypothetical protein